MANPQLQAYWAELERQRGLPAGYLARTRQIESAGDPNAVSPTGAIGPFQFTLRTAKEMGLAPNKRRDEFESARATADYAARNKTILQRALGRDPEAWELYMGHQQGGGGAAALLRNPNTPAGQLTNARNIRVNAGDPDAPAESILSKFRAKFGGAAPTQVAGGAPIPPERPVGLADQNAPAAPPQRPADLAPIREGGGLLGMARRWWNGTPTGAVAPSPGAIVGAAGAAQLAAASAPPPPRSELTAFMGSPEMAATLKGAGILANALSSTPAAAPQAPPLPVEDAHIPDMATLMAQLRKKGRL